MNQKRAPTVRVSTMSNLLDSLTVTLGANLPAKALRSEVMGVAREALKIHNAVEAERDQWKARAEQAEGVVEKAYGMLAWVSLIEHAKEGLEAWAEKPHNRKWWKRIDGTPIPNDLMICVAQAIGEAFRPLHDATERIVHPKTDRTQAAQRAAEKGGGDGQQPE